MLTTRTKPGMTMDAWNQMKYTALTEPLTCRIIGGTARNTRKPNRRRLRYHIMSGTPRNTDEITATTFSAGASESMNHPPCENADGSARGWVRCVLHAAETGDYANRRRQHITGPAVYHGSPAAYHDAPAAYHR